MAIETVTIYRGLEERQSIRNGKVRRSIRIDAQPMTIITDTRALGQPVANALAHHYRERVRNIQEKVSEATLKARAVAERALQRGAPWAMKRYTSSRRVLNNTGTLLGSGRFRGRSLHSLDRASVSDRMFNDSGLFARSIVANASSDNSWRINVAANRLNDSSAERIWIKLIELVPEFEDVSLVFETNSIVRETLKRVSAERIQMAASAADAAGISRAVRRSATAFEVFAAKFLDTGT
jgi:hypothetical protein